MRRARALAEATRPPSPLTSKDAEKLPAHLEAMLRDADLAIERMPRLRRKAPRAVRVCRPAALPARWRSHESGRGSVDSVLATSPQTAPFAVGERGLEDSPTLRATWPRIPRPSAGHAAKRTTQEDQLLRKLEGASRGLRLAALGSAVHSYVPKCRESDEATRLARAARAAGAAPSAADLGSPSQSALEAELAGREERRRPDARSTGRAAARHPSGGDPCATERGVRRSASRASGRARARTPGPVAGGSSAGPPALPSLSLAGSHDRPGAGRPSTVHAHGRRGAFGAVHGDPSVGAGGRPARERAAVREAMEAARVAAGRLGITDPMITRPDVPLGAPSLAAHRGPQAAGVSSPPSGGGGLAVARVDDSGAAQSQRAASAQQRGAGYHTFGSGKRIGTPWMAGPADDGGDAGAATSVPSAIPTDGHAARALVGRPRPSPLRPDRSDMPAPRFSAFDATRRGREGHGTARLCRRPRRTVEPTAQLNGLGSPLRLRPPARRGGVSPERPGALEKTHEVVVQHASLCLPAISPLGSRGAESPGSSEAGAPWPFVRLASLADDEAAIPDLRPPSRAAPKPRTPSWLAAGASDGAVAVIGLVTPTQRSQRAMFRDEGSPPGVGSASPDSMSSAWASVPGKAAPPASAPAALGHE